MENLDAPHTDKKTTLLVFFHSVWSTTDYTKTDELYVYKKTQSGHLKFREKKIVPFFFFDFFEVRIAFIELLD